MNLSLFGKSSAWLLALAALCGSGCSSHVDTKFTVRDEVKKLPAKHQQQIADYLHKYFGSINDPQLMVPAKDQPEGEQKEPVLVAAVDRETLRHGLQVYTQQCAGCHGASGDGAGPAAIYLDPPPRDYRLGRFKFGSTPRGNKPRRDDLARIVRRGAKGTSMPAFRWLAEEDLQAVIDYVMLLSQRGELEISLARDAETELEEADDIVPVMAAGNVTRIAGTWAEANSQVVLPLTPRPQYTAESIQLGAKAFIELQCFKCHGKDGRGNKAFNVGKDDWGRIAYAADLTSGMLRGGRRSVDIYRRIHSGINATPMPAFNSPDSSKNETAEQRSETIWHLSHFIMSIVQGQSIPTDVIEATIKALPSEAAAPPAPTSSQ